MARDQAPYREARYRRAYRLLRRYWHPCRYDGCPNRGISPDHVPPLARHEHVPDSGCCRLLPACRVHQAIQAGELMVESAERRSGERRRDPEAERLRSNPQFMDELRRGAYGR